LATTCLGFGALERVDPVLVSAGEPVGVPLERGGRLGVPELGRDIGDGRALGQELGREGVPEVVETEAGQLRVLEDAPPALRGSR
jgi:hypothetical protein